MRRQPIAPQLKPGVRSVTTVEEHVVRYEVKQSRLIMKLRGGDRRSIGRVPEVVRAVSKNTELAGELVVGLVSDDSIIRMRAADALEKVTKERPALLGPFKGVLLSAAADSDQQEVRWHLAQMLPRLELSRNELDGVISLLRGYLGDKSSIVKVCAMQALVELAARDPGLLSSIRPVIEAARRNGSPAMRSRGKKLLGVFGSKANSANDLTTG